MGVVVQPTPASAACTDPSLPECNETVFGALPLPDSAESSDTFSLIGGIDGEGAVVFAKCVADQVETDAACVPPRTVCNINIQGYAKYEAGSANIYEFGQGIARSDCAPGQVDMIESHVHISHFCFGGIEQTSNANTGSSPGSVVASAAQFVAKGDNGPRWCAKPTKVNVLFTGTFHVVRRTAPAVLCLQATATIGGPWTMSPCG